MKRITNLSTLIAILALLITFSSCNQRSRSVEVIPHDAILVTSINAKSLSSKANLKEVQKLEIYSMLRKELRNENRKLAQLFDDVVENSSTMGLNVSADMFFFLVPEGKYDDVHVCFSAEIKSADKWESFLKDFFKGIDEDFRVRDKSPYFIGYVDDQPMFIWDKTKVLFIATDSYRYRDEGKTEDLLTDMMETKAERRITKNDDFNKFYRSKKDISTWISFDFMENLGGYYLYALAGISFDEMYAHWHINFEKGKVVSNVHYTPNKDIRDLLKKYNLNKTFDPKILKYAPANNVLFLSGAANLENYYEFLSEEKDIRRIFKLLESELDFQIEDLFKAFNGSIFGGIHGFETMEVTSLGWGYILKTPSKKVDAPYSTFSTHLSESEKKELNRGKTVLTDYYDEVGLNIQNQILKGYTIEDVIAKDLEVTWTIGGWEYDYGVEKVNDETIPLFTVITDIKDRKYIEDNLLQIEEFVEVWEDFHRIKSADFPLYLVITDEVMVLTSDVEVAKAATKGGLNENMTSSKHLSNIKKYSGYFHVDLNLENYPQVVKDLINNEGKLARKVVSIVDNLLDNIEVYGDSYTDGSGVLNLHDSKENSLFLIIKMIDNIVMANMGSDYDWEDDYEVEEVIVEAAPAVEVVEEVMVESVE